jgi:hypothetical protein
VRQRAGQRRQRFRRPRQRRAETKRQRVPERLELAGLAAPLVDGPQHVERVRVQPRHARGQRLGQRRRPRALVAIQ